jgi:NADPH:quinone reductase-like Zn-dependent oxidoreductase
MLVYRGQWPERVLLDDTIPALAREFSYPLKYGYSAVGRIVETGSAVDAQWLNKHVFSFNPHESHFLALPDQLIPLPDAMPPEEAALLPNMETAVSFIMDGRPLIGEQVAVFGQGVVGLLTTASLARFPLAGLFTLDAYRLRRQCSVEFGATESLDPTGANVIDELRQCAHAEQAGDGFDLILRTVMGQSRSSRSGHRCHRIRRPLQWSVRGMAQTGGSRPGRKISQGPHQTDKQPGEPPGP